jgi:thiopeptide-type bacteriocin biosynthesis protein
LRNDYLASPVLYAECIKLKEGKIKTVKDIKKIRVSLIKYYQRMYSRCTPFGLFSGCAVMQWSNAESKVLFEAKDMCRSTRLDMHYLCALAQQLALIPVIKNRIFYFPNTSIYKIGNEIRFMEYKYVNAKREHQISAVLHSDYLDLLLSHAKCGITIQQMSELLSQKIGVTNDEAIAFIDEIIENQVLVNELEPAITGKEFIYQLLEILQRINYDENEKITGVIKMLQSIEKDIRLMDKANDNSINPYKQIIEKITQLNIPFEESKLFQADLFRKPAENIIAAQIQNSLLNAFSFLNALNHSKKNDNLTSFIKKFNERYEGKQMPLLQVLDVESGIAYAGKSGKNLSPILDNIVLPDTARSEDYNIQWNKVQSWLFKKLSQAYKDDVFEVEIRVEDVKQFAAQWDDVPPSAAVLFRLLNDNKIILEGISGSSAANLLGRFAHGNTDVDNLVKNIVAQEEQLNSEVIFAEIIHLPQSRTGNILLHPAFRKYEIPFLAKSSLSVEQQITLDDLYISVVNGHIKLFSRRLQKEVIPRLSSAHNFSYKALPVYHFLCDLQAQNLRNNFSFSWGNMAGQFSFLPRVVFENIILFEATWQLKKIDYEILFRDNGIFLPDFVSKWKMPRYIILADGDNELLVDFDNIISVEVFIDVIKHRDAIVIKEFLFDTSGKITNEKGEFYINQCIAPLIKTTNVYQTNSALLNLNEKTIPQNFPPGSEWIYYKLYCGEKSADKILQEFIQPLVISLLKNKKIDKWFFIRYNDPDFHLRIRFHLVNKDDTGYVINTFSQAMNSGATRNLIWKTQIDTYTRELDRYTPKAMELAETLFFKDSMQTLSFLNLTQGDEREHARWLWGIKSTDQLLNSFDFTVEEKYQIAKANATAFAKEFNADKLLFQQFNKKYALARMDIKNIINNSFDEKSQWVPLMNLCSNNANDFKSIAQAIIVVNRNNYHPNLQNLISSYIHMSVNRLFISEARFHEMIIYDCLCKYYYTEIKIQANNK